MSLSIITFSIMTFSTTKFSIAVYSITTFRIMIFCLLCHLVYWHSIKQKGTQNNDTQYNDTLHKGTQHNDTRCWVLFGPVSLLLGVAIKPIMLSVFQSNVIRLSVVAPSRWLRVESSLDLKRKKVLKIKYECRKFYSFLLTLFHGQGLYSQHFIFIVTYEWSQ